MNSTLPLVRAGSWYHVMNRESIGAPPLSTPEAKDRFVTSLGEMAYTAAVEIHAYCAMENHYHVLVRGDEDDVRRAFAALDDRCEIASDGVRLRRMALGRHLLQVTRYIHRNPCEAGLVIRPDAWTWSSYRGYLDPLDGPPWLFSRVALGWLGVGGRQRYRTYVDAR